MANARVTPEFAQYVSDVSEELLSLGAKGMRDLGVPVEEREVLAQEIASMAFVVVAAIEVAVSKDEELGLLLMERVARMLEQQALVITVTSKEGLSMMPTEGIQ